MRRLREIDYGILTSSILLSVLGLVGIWGSKGGNSPYFVKQILWITLSLIVFFLLVIIDYDKLINLSPWLYGGLILSLIPLLRGGGVSSWFKIGGVWFQPSELGKIILPLFLTKIMTKKAPSPLSFPWLVKISAIAGVPIILISFQPDLGTAFIYLSFILSAIIVFGMKKVHVKAALALSILIFIFSWFFLLKGYQKDRIISFLNPSEDTRGRSFQIYQSKVSIGSGKFFGKGLKEISQAKLKFLPAAHTDFIFSVIAESFGFLGVIVVFLLYAVLFLRIFKIGAILDEERAIILLYLTAGWLAFQVVFNLLIAVGLFPVTGFPLPFMSYGGSDLLSSYASLGVVNSILAWRWK